MRVTFAILRSSDFYSFSSRFILHAKKTAFVIEHDFIMATYLADRVIVFEGQPAVAATATPYVPPRTAPRRETDDRVLGRSRC